MARRISMTSIYRSVCIHTRAIHISILVRQQLMHSNCTANNSYAVSRDGYASIGITTLTNIHGLNILRGISIYFRAYFSQDFCVLQITWRMIYNLCLLYLIVSTARCNSNIHKLFNVFQ